MMKAKVQIVEVERTKKSTVNDKTEVTKDNFKKLRVKRGREAFLGATFSKALPACDKITKVVEEVVVVGSVFDIMLKAYGLMEKHGLIKERTLITMCYWQYLNNFSNTVIRAAQGVGSDSEMLASLPKSKAVVSKMRMQSVTTQSAA